MQTVSRDSIQGEEYREIFAREPHHNHEVIQDDDGVLRWKKDDVGKAVDRLDLNGLTRLLYSLGYGKNSEIYRRIYRGMGYSLSGYWEIFYWETNNEEADQYKAPQ